MSISKLHSRIIAVLIALTMVLSLSVTDAHAEGSKSITLKGCNKPSTVILGNPYSIKGTIKAKSKIEKVEIGIVAKSTGKWKFKYTKKGINKKTFSIKKADNKLRFGKLKKGTYYYRIYVQLKGKGRKKVLNHKFTVEDKNAESIGLGNSEAPNVSLSGCNAPGTFSVGKEFFPKGIVTCESTIKKVEVGIVFAPTNKWTEYKYTANVNSESFDLSTVNPSLRFDQLPGGTYRYRMYAHTEEGVIIVFDQEFTVNPSDKPQMAVNWAINIANDDTFNYGAKPIANAIGCYFCGTNDKKVERAKKAKIKKPERYEKTYVCMTFVGAAYAHGAGDPEILDQCQKRRMTLYETNDNFTKFSCWMKIGLCKDLTINDLQPGDVLIKWSDRNDNNGHACMYIGGDDLVESSGGGWGANSIGVKEGVAASRLASLSNNSKNYVMRYRH